MMSHNEILLIDDFEDFAEETVEFIKLHCGVDAIYALDGETAKELLKQNPIKIILLDYDFKKPETGLDLFPELKKIDPNVKIVFISAVATAEVLYRADKFRFDAKIVKTALATELPQLIPTLLVEYSKSFDTVNNKTFFSKKKRCFFSNHTVDYSIVNYNIINKEYVYPDSWKTYQMITSGESKSNNKEFKYEKTFDLATSFSFESDFEHNFETHKVIEIKTNLATKLDESLKSGYNEKIKGTIKWMKELSLDGNLKNNSVVSRYYDYARIYMQIKIFIKKKCSCCDEFTIIPTTVYFPLPSIKYRIREYYDNQPSRTIDSGLYNG